MSAMYLLFAAVPIIAVAIAFLPEISGKSEAVPVGGFEYSVIPPRRYLVLGGLGIGLFGMLFLLLTEGKLPASGVLAAVVLVLCGIFEILSAFCIIFYFGYRLTVRAGVIFYKIPCRRELILPIPEIDYYSVKKRRNGEVTLRISTKKRTVIAVGRGADILLCELERRQIKRKNNP